MAEIRLVVVNDKGEPIYSSTLWRVGHPQAAVDLATRLAARLRTRPSPKESR